MKKIFTCVVALSVLASCGGPDGTAEDTDGIAANNHRIFVSSSTYTGLEIGSLANANSKCKSLAQAVGLTRDYKAIISTTTNPATDLNITGSIYLFTATGTKALVAASESELWGTDSSQNLYHAVNVDEQFTTVSSAKVWTGTTNNGGVANDNCNDWASSSGSGWYGLTSSVDDTWIESNTANCTESYRIYCISQ